MNLFTFRNVKIFLAVSLLLSIMLVVFIIVPFIVFGASVIGKPAPDFTSMDIEGDTFKLSDQSGKVVLLDFFATWCGPCRAMIPILRELREEFNSSVIILSIDVDATEDVNMLRNFRAANNITWPILRDTSGISSAYGINAIPTFYLIGSDGIVRYHNVGTTDKSSIKREIEAALRNEPIPSNEPIKPITWIVLLCVGVLDAVAIAFYLRFRKRGT